MLGSRPSRRLLFYCRDMEGIGIEAILLYRFSLGNGLVLEDGVAEYGIRLGEMDARELLELIELAKRRLEELGVPPQSVKLPERLRISKELQIFLPDRGEMEMHLQPLVKTLFLFFLKHPEGIAFKDLPDHRDELFRLYSKISPGMDPQSMRDAIDRLADPTSNSVNTMRSRLSKSLSDLFQDDRLVEHYRISGSAGVEKLIHLDRKYVIWE